MALAYFEWGEALKQVGQISAATEKFEIAEKLGYSPQPKKDPNVPALR